jgi:chromate transporter
MMHDEVVKRRRWLNDQEFLDLVGATNLIPGPNSTEMPIHLGFLRAGWPGLIVGGVCFVVPAMLIVLILAWAYVIFGQLPQAQWLLYGIKPVVIAIIIQAIWNLGRKAAKNLLLLMAGLVILCLYWFLHANEIVLLFASGLVVMAIGNFERLRTQGTQALLPPAISFSILSSGVAVAATAFSLPILFLTFLKIGAILYGSGYVLLAFLRSDLVLRLHWLTDQQLLDAIAIGQVTPGPLFTSATFIGYILGGVPAAVLATVGIFLPSFAFVAISNPLIPKVRASPWVSGFLDGVNIAALSLMAGVTIQLGWASLVDLPTLVIGAVALGLLLRYGINSTWLIAGGAIAGILVSAIL